MNREQLSRAIGKPFRLRPMATRFSEDGKPLEAIDDQWILQELKSKHIVLLNPRTDHRVELGNDNLREFRSPDYLLTRCNIILKGIEVRVEPIIENATVGSASAKLEIYYEKVNITQARHDYRLIVAVTNIGIAAISNYHVDLEFPSALLHQSVHHALRVPDRTTRTYGYFRVTQKDHLGKPIYPGDKKTVMSLDYYIDSALYDLENKLFKEVAKATLYVEGVPPQSTERKIADLQIF